ncbi:MAG: hypothetical protein L6435_17615, partial [Anaerolineae bacterium]|nr:hypothetical protein [Anaerolineae bacterium]
DLSMGGTRQTVEFAIAGTLDLFPTQYPDDEPFFVGNLDYAFQQPTAPPPSVEPVAACHALSNTPSWEARRSFITRGALSARNSMHDGD